MGFSRLGRILKNKLGSAILVLFCLCFGFSRAQAQAESATSPAVQQPGTPQSSPDAPAVHEKAAEQLKQQEHQRILGVLPNFNTSNVQDAVALTRKQKFQLAFRSAVDPVQFFVAGLDAGFNQANNSYSGYGQGAQGYFKRWGAAYADSFDGTMLGGAVFPALLHQDPRYFRKGTGTVKQRLFYAISTTVRCKNDDGKWVPNYSNILGNIAAGGIANLYYPDTDTGAGLTFQRAFTVTAEGAIGALFVEFWPDISRKLFNKH
jgi:hypothetical protein